MIHAAEQAITFSRSTLCIFIVLGILALYVIATNKKEK